MKELVCRNCSSKDIEYKGGLWVCSHCGSRFLPDKHEKPEESRLDKLEEEFIDIINEWQDIEDWDESQWKKKDKLERKWRSMAEKILEIEANNPFVYTAYMLKRIGAGLDSRSAVQEFVRYAGIVADNADPEERDKVYPAVRINLSAYKDKCISEAPELEEQIESIMEKIG